MLSFLKVVLFITILLTIVFSIIPGQGHNLSHWDKVGHFSAYAGIYFLVLWIYCQRHAPNSRRYLCKKYHSNLAFYSFIDLFLLGTSLEFIQYHLPTRSFSIYDIVANTCGLLFALFMYRHFSQRLAKHRHHQTL